MYPDTHTYSGWIMHPPKNSMYSPSYPLASTKPALGQNKIIPTITPSPISPLHAKQRYRLKDSAPKSQTRVWVDNLNSQRPPVPDHRAAAGPSFNPPPSFPGPLHQGEKIVMRNKPDVDDPQVSRFFPKRRAPTESQSQPRQGTNYVAPGPSNLSKYVVYQTPGPKLDRPVTPVLPVKTSPTVTCPSPTSLLTPVSWIHPALVREGYRPPVEWDLTQPFMQCKLPHPGSVKRMDFQFLPAFTPVLPTIHISIGHIHQYHFTTLPSRPILTREGHFVPSILTFMTALHDKLYEPLSDAHWKDLSLPEKVSLAVSMASRRREALPEFIAQFVEVTKTCKGGLESAYDHFMLQSVDAVVDAFVYTTDSKPNSFKNTKSMKVRGIDYVGERTLFNGVSWDKARGEFRIDTTYPELDHTVISSLYITFADHIELCDKDAPV